MSYTAADYRLSLSALLPPGAAWPREPATTLQRLLAGLAVELARVDARGAVLLEREADPRATVELLADWERAFGLPDTCIGEAASDALRRAALVQRITGIGGQSPAYYVALAASVGVPVEVVEYRPHTVDDDCEAPWYGDAWAYAWEVRASAVEVYHWTVEDSCEDPLASWSAGAHECLIERAKPAHTHVLFTYV